MNQDYNFKAQKKTLKNSTSHEMIIQEVGSDKTTDCWLLGENTKPTWIYLFEPLIELFEIWNIILIGGCPNSHVQ